MAKLIPIYTWNKNMLAINRRSDRLSKKPWFQGALLLLCVVVAMLLANLPFTKHFYHAFLETSLQLHFASPDGSVNVLFPRDLTVEKFINDVLMVIFFFTVGLEIRREVSHGELSSVKKAMLPVIAANVSLSPPRDMALRMASSKPVLSRNAMIAWGTVC